jgi:hypothetical protein
MVPMRVFRLVSIGAALWVPSFVAAHEGTFSTLTHLGPKTISLAVGAAAVDAFNPAALGVLLLLLRARQTTQARTRDIVRVGTLYVAGIVVAYLAAGYGIHRLLLGLGPSFLTEGLQILMAFLLFMVGIREIDAAYNETEAAFPLVQRAVDAVTGATLRVSGRAAPVLLGLVFGIAELFLTGAIYLQFIRGITYDPTVHRGVLATFIAIYMAVFILPLTGAIYGAATGSRMAQRTQGALQRRKYLHLAFAAVFMGVAVWLTVRALNILLTL